MRESYDANHRKVERFHTARVISRHAELWRACPLRGQEGTCLGPRLMMLWAAPPPAPKGQVAAGVTRLGGGNDASGDDDWSRPRKVSFPDSWRRRARQCGGAPSAEAPPGSVVLPEAAAVPRWH